MKITKQYLKQLIKEELEKVTTEGDFKKGFKQGDYLSVISYDEDTVMNMLMSQPPSAQLKQLLKDKLVNNPKMSNLLISKLIKNELPEEYVLMIKSGGLGPTLKKAYEQQIQNGTTAQPDGTYRKHKYARTGTDKFFGVEPITRKQFK